MDDFSYKKVRKNRAGSLDGYKTVGGKTPTKQFNRTFQSGSVPRSEETDFNRAEGFHKSDFVARHDAANKSVFAGKEPEQRVFSEDLAPRPDEPKSKRGFLRRKQKLDTPRARRKRKFFTLKRAGIVTLILILLAGGGLGYVYYKYKKIFRGGSSGTAALEKNPDPSRLKGEGDGRVNILILGKGGPTQSDGPDLTDTIILASIDPVQNEAALLSLPRDFYIKNTSNYRVNSIYAEAKQKALASDPNNKDAAETAGITAAKDKVSEIFGVPIQYSVMVDFTAFQKAIDTVGDITIDVKEPVAEQMLLNGRPYYLNVKTGTQSFDGLKALAYARCRHCDARSDFGRSQRQREIIIALKEKVMSGSTYSNPYKIQQLISTFGDNVRTDIGTNEIGRFFEIAKQISSDKIASISLVDEPNVLLGSANVYGNAVQQPTAGPNDYSEIQAFVRNALRDSFLKNEDAKIIILNGTETSGLAGKTSKELKSFGYTVTKVGDAPTHDYINTYVVDLTKGQKKYTQSYLERRMQVTATDQLPDPTINAEGVDFVIVIGKNEADRQAN